jgi:hypothetical protein
MLLAQKVIAVVFLGIGIALAVETLAIGAGPLSVGFLASLVFLALGVVRWRAVRGPQ